jgi:hypothetical protein
MAASGLKQADIQAYLNAAFRATAYTTSTSPLRGELTTTAPTATANGTPVSGGSYAKQNITFAAPSGTAVASSGSVAYTGMPAATVVGMDILDSAGSPSYKAYGVFGTSITTLAGDTISFASGAITVTITNTP